VVAEGLVYAGDQYGHLRAFEAQTGKLLLDFETGADYISTRGVANGVVYCLSPSQLLGVDARRLRGGEPVPMSWTSDEHFWSCVIWGKGGLAVRKVAEGCALGQIPTYDNWESGDALATELDRLASLGDWNAEDALARDPATLCPPELAFDAAVKDGQGKPVRAAAQVYLGAARATTGELTAQERLEYAQEAVRLAPEWAEAEAVVAELAARGG
jgi:hypothetical protein